MSIESVKKQFKEDNISFEILEFESSSATVDLAAEVLGVEPGQIAKTMAFKIGEENILVVSKGDARIDNRKYKDQFKTKAKMLSFEEVLDSTGHPVGGVCPFGLKNPIKVYLDESLKNYEVVYPAAGSSNSAVKVPVEALGEVTNGTWINVCKE